METRLADKIQNYITNLLGGQVNIADTEGQILSSSAKNSGQANKKRRRKNHQNSDFGARPLKTKYFL